MLKFSGAIILRLGTRATFRRYSSVSVSEKVEPNRSISDNTKVSNENGLGDNQEKSGLIAAAFASLNSPESMPVSKKPSAKSTKQSRLQQMDNQILNATDVNSLLTMAENPVISRRHALKMVSILSEWSTSKKVHISVFEKDPRFLKLCRILARTTTTEAMSTLTGAEDLSTVLVITGDDEAARLISNLSLIQMIKVMKALQQKGRRSTPLLQSLSYNITKQPETINLKRSADLLFSMVSLNFPDPVLLDRICSDIIKCLPSNEDKPAVVVSIMVSLGLLKHRHEPALTAIADWIQEHTDQCRACDIASAIITFATVNYTPPNVERLFKFAVSFKEEEMIKSSTWLDLVFSLLILNMVEQHHLVSVIQSDFIEKLLSTGEISIPVRRKLIAIDAYLRLTSPSTSTRLPEFISVDVPIVHTKEKALFVQNILDTFKSLVSSERFLKKNCDSGMGFLYDAEFAVDAKCHPLALEKAATDKSAHRIAVMGLNYHDMTRKVAVPLGIFELYKRLLQLKGFKVLTIPYTEYNPKEKLVTRVQYIENKLKELIKEQSS